MSFKFFNCIKVFLVSNSGKDFVQYRQFEKLQIESCIGLAFDRRVHGGKIPQNIKAWGIRESKKNTTAKHSSRGKLALLRHAGAKIRNQQMTCELFNKKIYNNSFLLQWTQNPKANRHSTWFAKQFRDHKCLSNFWLSHSNVLHGKTAHQSEDMSFLTVWGNDCNNI